MLRLLRSPWTPVVLLLLVAGELVRVAVTSDPRDVAFAMLAQQATTGRSMLEITLDQQHRDPKPPRVTVVERGGELVALSAGASSAGEDVVGTIQFTPTQWSKALLHPKWSERRVRIWIGHEGAPSASELVSVARRVKLDQLDAGELDALGPEHQRRHATEQTFSTFSRPSAREPRVVVDLPRRREQRPLGYLLDALTLGALLLGLLLLAAAAWRALRRRRRRARDRCPGCGYDLEGIDAEPCPECGAERPADA